MMMHFDQWWNSQAADAFRAENPDIDGEAFRPVWDAAAAARERCAPLSELSFGDALKIARGCTDYGGGYRYDAEKLEIYQHGIQTVINALDAAATRGLVDTQVMALHCIGSNVSVCGNGAAGIASGSMKS